MTDQLRYIHDRIKWAEENLTLVNRMLVEYFWSDFYTVTIRNDPDADPQIRMDPWKVKFPPERAATLIGTIIHELRSSLDHLAWALVEENGGVPGKGTDFPILDVPPTANRYGRHPLPNVQGGVSEPARRLIDKVQPYHATAVMELGFHPLAVLQHLWNVEKHRHIVIKTVQMQFPRIIGPGLREPFTGRFETVRADKRGADVQLVTDPPEVDVQGDTSFHMWFHSEPDMWDTDVSETLDECLEVVRRIVIEAQSTCFDL